MQKYFIHSFIPSYFRMLDARNSPGTSLLGSRNLWAWHGYNNASGFLLGTVWLADFWQISQNYVTQDPDPKRKAHGKSPPHVSVQVNCGFLAYCASWLKVQVSCWILFSRGGLQGPTPPNWGLFQHHDLWTFCLSSWGTTDIIASVRFKETGSIMTQLISNSRPVPKRSKGYIPGGYSTILHDQYSGIPATLVGLLNMTSIWFILGLVYEDKITIDNPCHPCMAKFLPTLIPYKSTIHVGKQTSPMDGTVDGSEILHQLRKR